MEIKIEAVEGCDMPSNSYVAVKLGDALKQGRYEPARSYIFPKVNKRVYAKIDVFKHVGTQSMLVNPDAGSNACEIDITSNDPTVGNLRLKVDIKPNSLDKMPSKLTKSVARDQAASYLEKHRIEETLSKSMKSLLQSQPDDPIGFLCCALQAKPYQPVADTSAMRLDARQVSEVHAKQNPNFDTNRARQGYCAQEDTEEKLEGEVVDFNSVRAALAQASNDGSLFDLLQASKSPFVAQDASLLPQAMPQENSRMLTWEDLESNRVNNLCMHATDLLLKASQDGVLRGVISATKDEHDKLSKLASSDDRRVTTLRGRACLTLASASLDGRLQQALAGDTAEDVNNLNLPPVEGNIAVQLHSGLSEEISILNTTGTSKQKVIFGLVESARAIAGTCPVSAAGLAKAAADVAEELCAILGSTCSISPGVVTGLAETAAWAAATGAPTAPGLIEAAVATCVNIARTVGN